MGEVGIDVNMAVPASSSVFQSASAAHSLWNRGLLGTLADPLLLLPGTTIIAVCRGFTGSLSRPPDSTALTAMSLLFGFIASMGWFDRFALRATVLWPPAAISNHRPRERSHVD